MSETSLSASKEANCIEIRIFTVKFPPGTQTWTSRITERRITSKNTATILHSGYTRKRQEIRKKREKKRTKGKASSTKKAILIIIEQSDFEDFCAAFFVLLEQEIGRWKKSCPESSYNKECARIWLIPMLSKRVKCV